MIHHSDRRFIGNQAGNRRCRGISGNRDHVKPHGADTSHGLQFFQGQSAAVHGVDHPLVFADRNKCAAQSSHIGGRHHAALFYLIIEQCQRSRCAGRADGFQSHFFQDFRHAVADSRSRGQGKIQNAKRYAETRGCLLGHQLTHACHLESRFFDRFAEHFEILSPHPLQSTLHHAGAADADIDDGIAFGHAVESACHEGVVVRRITEHHQLGTAKGILVSCLFRRLQDHLAHQLNRIHVQAGFRGSDVHGTAYPLGGGQRLRDR